MKPNTLFKWFFSSASSPDSNTTSATMTTPDDQNLGLGLGLGSAFQAPSDSKLDHSHHQSSDADLDDDHYLHQSLSQELQNLVLMEESRNNKLAQESGWNVEEGDENINNNYNDSNNNSYTEEEVEVDEEEEEGGEGKIGKEGDEILEHSNTGGDRRVLYPVRPEAEDCPYYMRTGSCRFGSNCKFNHPLRRKTQGLKSTRDKTKEKEEPRERLGQTECKYYLKTGGCRFGKACRFNHARAKAPVAPVLELNFLGLPIRLGERECPYYMRTGSCKYGATCKFNHPDPTAGGGDASEYSNGGSSTLQSPSHFPVAAWSAPGPLNEAAPGPFVPMLYPPTQGVTSPHAEWNGYQFPVTPPGPTLHHPPAYVMKPGPAETHKYSHNQQQMVVDEFPERPGQPECSYYLKTGGCKFKSNCKYHHPRDRIKRSVSVVLSDKGLPLRPDQIVCSYYNRYGICKFGPSCKFDHPVDLSPTSGSASNHQPSVFNSAKADGPTVASTLNVSDAVIQQSV